MRFSRASSDSFDALKSPIIPALVFMTMTSFAPTNITYKLYNSATGTCQDGVGGAHTMWRNLPLFLEETEGYRPKQNRVGQLALEKGVNLPVDTSYLPDETIDFLATQGITPDFVNPSQDDSLIIEFTADKKYYMAEFYEDGEIVLLTRDNASRNVWGLNSDTYLKKLKQELAVELEPSFID